MSSLSSIGENCMTQHVFLLTLTTVKVQATFDVYVLNSSYLAPTF